MKELASYWNWSVLLGHWRALADWTASQPVLVQLAVGSTILLAAYVAFVLVIRTVTSVRR